MLYIPSDAAQPALLRENSLKDCRKLVPPAGDVGAAFQKQLKYRRAAYPATVLEVMNHTLEQKEGGLVLPGNC